MYYDGTFLGLLNPFALLCRSSSHTPAGCSPSCAARSGPTIFAAATATPTEPNNEKEIDMWYFAWILGLSLAASFAILNAIWLEIPEECKPSLPSQERGRALKGSG